MNDKIKAAAAAKRTVITGMASGALIALYGLWISRSHITHIGYAIGLNPLEAETLFVFIDFVAIYGKMLTSKRLSAKTRRIGYKFLAFGGVASLGCNVASGILHGSIGGAAYGAFIVGIVAALEYAIANTKAKAVVGSAPRETGEANPVVRTQATTVSGTSEARMRAAKARQMFAQNPSMTVAELAAAAGVGRNTAKRIVDARVTSTISQMESDLV
ncbi:MAG: hypothetical protein ABWZ52_13775 [Acidimicrobiales bacterium]